MTARAKERRTAEAALVGYAGYVQQIRLKLETGMSTEHTYRPALQDYLESIPEITAINEPTRIKCGAPDFIVSKSNVPVGYIEAKDIDEPLDEVETSEQLMRYRASLPNLILTDYLEFRWYVNGEYRKTIRIGRRRGRTVEFFSDAESQLNQLYEEFLSLEVKTITSAEELAVRLASSARNIHDLIISTIEFADEESLWLRKWLVAFKDVLIGDLDEKMFADMFAQTLAYGFFAARIHTKDPKYFSRLSAAQVLPKTNPFLKRLFSQFAGGDMPGSITWAVDEIIELLKRIDIDLFLTDFGKAQGKEDPVIHFYETFLKHYDNKLRFDRGVFYTPVPIVDFIVRSANQLLIDTFSKPNGLAEESALILDPAVGTGSFLQAVTRHIQAHLPASTDWDQYVSQNLLKRLSGFEILMAPYAIAHLKLGLELQKSGYKFSGSQRLGVFLTNSLEESARKSEAMFANFISDEADEAGDIKRNDPVVAILGNPPYSISSRNKGEWILNLLKDYKKGLNERKLNLDDDFIKFIRFAQWRIEKTGAGVVGYITNNTFLDGITHRQMRKSLLESFDQIYVLNLHGSHKRLEKTPEGDADENVFDIQQGVAITFFIRTADRPKISKVYYSDSWGTREEKYAHLSMNDIRSIKWAELPIDGEMCFFVPRDTNLKSEYDKFVGLKDIFATGSSGIQTKRDNVAIAFTEESLKQNIRDFATKPADRLRDQFNLPADGRDWSIEWAKAHSKEIAKSWGGLTPIQYRPFDHRWTVLEDKSKGIVAYPRFDVMSNMTRANNIGLITVRQISSECYRHAWATKSIIDGNSISLQTREYNYIFPLFINPENETPLNIRRPNFTPQFSRFLKANYPKATPESVFNYIYAVLNAAAYTEKYVELLKSDFAKIPFTKNQLLFDTIADLGSRLVVAHTDYLELKSKTCAFNGEGTNAIERVKYDRKGKKILINETQYFSGVSNSVWDFRVGGFLVCEKWLKGRAKATLTTSEIEEFLSILCSIEETLVLQVKINSHVKHLVAATEQIHSIRTSDGEAPDQISEDPKRTTGDLTRLKATDLTWRPVQKSLARSRRPVAVQTRRRKAA